MFSVTRKRKQPCPMTRMKSSTLLNEEKYPMLGTFFLSISHMRIVDYWHSPEKRQKLLQVALGGYAIFISEVPIEDVHDWIKTDVKPVADKKNLTILISSRYRWFRLVEKVN